MFNKEINILDIGCGTGGDIVGLLMVLDHYLPKDVKFNVYAFDGNEFALKYMDRAVSALRQNAPCNRNCLKPKTRFIVYDIALLHTGAVTTLIGGAVYSFQQFQKEFIPFRISGRPDFPP